MGTRILLYLVFAAVLLSCREKASYSEHVAASSGQLRTLHIPVRHLRLLTSLPAYTIGDRGVFEEETRLDIGAEVLLTAAHERAMYLVLGIKTKDDEYDFRLSPGKKPLFLRFDAAADIDIITDVLTDKPDGIDVVYYRASTASLLAKCPELVEKHGRLTRQGLATASQLLVLGQTGTLSWVYPVTADGLLWSNYFARPYGISRHCLAETSQYGEVLLDLFAIDLKELIDAGEEISRFFSRAVLGILIKPDDVIYAYETTQLKELISSYHSNVNGLMDELLSPIDLEQMALSMDNLLRSFSMNAIALFDAVDLGSPAEELNLLAARFTNYLFHHRCALLRLATQDAMGDQNQDGSESFEALLQQCTTGPQFFIIDAQGNVTRGQRKSMDDELLGRN